MINKEKLFPRKLAPKSSARMVEVIFGCKWSLTVYQLLAQGINRPGEMVNNVEGLSTKVLNQCLKRNIEFGILEKIVFNELPPRVEYQVTTFGEQFLVIIEQLEKLQSAIDEQSTRRNPLT
ncbi:winged helix-turn-helix transcriptional regulator [Algibacillus agarilyticus]|uniref:winged helix-turn-helix transcriptional regulator n=1 Tax=Algibacillus agarilyticus TaxID=2234133 RepID=UPI000DCF7BAA|nr:helix-turn-helix domain-containing protein [Algibacillus agarilyticus]